jgi:hypothetical protein
MTPNVKNLKQQKKCNSVTLFAFFTIKTSTSTLTGIIPLKKRQRSRSIDRLSTDICTSTGGLSVRVNTYANIA